MTQSDTRPVALPENLELLLPDINGIPRGKLIRSQDYKASALPRMAEAILYQTLTGEYADLVDQYNPDDHDMQLRAHWASYCAPSEHTGQVGQVICETLNADNQPLPQDSRNVLKRLLAAYQAEGLYPVVAPELEFYLLEPVKHGDPALSPALGIGGAAEFGGESFSPGALQKFSPVIDSIRSACQHSPIELTALVHEMGPAQIELNMSHGDALSRADHLFLLKHLIKSCAQKQGLLASFMAKPLAGHPGNGLHLHCSMLDAQGRNRFALQNSRVPEKLNHFIGGLQRYLPEAFALVAPNVNSYKRFAQAQSSPTNLSWGYDNRTAGLRIPHSKPEDGRVENRIGGADANPYLAIVATLACGLLGLQKEIPASEAFEDDAQKLPADTPPDLADALRRLTACSDLGELLGKEFVDTFSSAKWAELSHASRSITPWEIAYLGSAL